MSDGFDAALEKEFVWFLFNGTNFYDCTFCIASRRFLKRRRISTILILHVEYYHGLLPGIHIACMYLNLVNGIWRAADGSTKCSRA